MRHSLFHQKMKKLVYIEVIFVQTKKNMSTEKSVGSHEPHMFRVERKSDTFRQGLKKIIDY